MNKFRLSFLAIMVVAVLVQTGCSGEANFAGTENSIMADYAPKTYDSDAAKDVVTNAYDGLSSEVASEYGSEYDEAGALPEFGISKDYAQEKIVYRSEICIETLEYEKTLAKIEAMVESANAYIEQSDVGGYGYNFDRSRSSLRAEYVIRIPVQNFTTFKDEISSIGNVSYSKSSAENVALKFFDTESRLATYRVEEERLLQMLENCYTVEEMITVESRLSQVRYEIESLTTTLRKMQNEIDYSTLTLYVNQVIEYTPAPEPPPVTYGEKMWNALVDSTEALIELLKGLLLALISALPFLVIPAIIIVVVVFWAKRKVKKGKLNNIPAIAPIESQTEEKNDGEE